MIRVFFIHKLKNSVTNLVWLYWLVMQNALAWLYLACASFVICFLGEFFFNLFYFYHIRCFSIFLFWFWTLFLEGYCWTRTSGRQATRMRCKYLKAVLRQEVSYFDLQVTSTSEIITSVSNDTLIIQDVLSEKVIDKNKKLAYSFFFTQIKWQKLW
jgi:ATP-binding cassette subfamily B (MDR/TAP) protein 1